MADPVSSTPPSTGVLPSGATNTLVGNAQANSNDFGGLMAQSTAQTLQQQLIMINHNLTVGPAMVAKALSDDAKKT